MFIVVYLIYQQQTKVFYRIWVLWKTRYSLYKFANSIEKKKQIYLFNKGKMGRSFTYIDDITDIVYKLINKIPKKKKYKKFKIKFK